MSKRALDLVVAGLLLVFVGWLIPLLALAARLGTGESGIFLQKRLGVDGVPFRLLKIRSMRTDDSLGSVTARDDQRITPLGRFLRRTKLDELPQLWNVVRGEMSIVGPRPELPGRFDQRNPIHRRVLSVRPGLTGPSTLLFLDEEEILSGVADPFLHDTDVLFPRKIEANLEYIDTWSIRKDLKWIMLTAVHICLPREVLRRVRRIP